MKFYFQTKGQVFLMNYEQFRRGLHGGNCETGTLTGLCVRVEPKEELWPHHSSRLLKKTANCVLASLRGSTMRETSSETGNT
jgi:hypothetical protein